MKRVPIAFLLAAATLVPPFLARLASADEGMWTFDRIPRAEIQKQFGVDLTEAWLDHLRLSTVRVGSGCSGSFVSADGLVLTELDRDYEGDTRFPDWDRKAWRVSQKETHTAASGVRFDFVLYEPA